MNQQNNGVHQPRPITVLVAALGGEGGGVLAEWLVEAARLSGFYAQSTSIPGVAQRTGATTYYIEVFPVPITELGGLRPVLSLSAVPGSVDLLVASELLEALRHLQNGLVTPDRTMLVMSTHRALTTLERMQPGDGRYDSQQLISLASQQSRRLVGFDMEALAQKVGTVPSALMFGAIAASGLLPFRREVFEQVIRDSGKGVKASLAGFSEAWNVTQQGEVTLPVTRAAAAVEVREDVRSFPPVLYDTLTRGLSRVEAFQDKAYGLLYLERVRRVCDLEAQIDPESEQVFALTREMARYLALWMSFDDLIRVAYLKCRASRFERVRSEVKAGPDDLLRIVDHFKPGIPEVAGILPAAVAKRLLNWDSRRQARGKPSFSIPLHLKTTSISGFIGLRLLAALRGVRRFGLRYHEEQVLIERWLDHVCLAATKHWSLAYELALCGRLIKGYGSTNERGKHTLLQILKQVELDASRQSDPEQVVRQMREAALADVSADVMGGGRAEPVRQQPVMWVKPSKT